MKNRTKLTRPDGTIIVIVIELNAYGEGGFELADVLVVKTKRGIAKTVCDFEDIRHLRNLDERAEFRQREFLKHVTPSEVLAAKLELWEKIKPTT